MTQFDLKRRQTLGTLGALAAFPLIGCGSGSSSPASNNAVNYVYTMTNAQQNAVARFRLEADGNLTYLDQTLTGGEGSLGRSPEDTSPSFDINNPNGTYSPEPDSLVCQSSLFVSQAEGLLFCVNAGNPYASSAGNTSSISVFSIGANGSLKLKSNTKVGGIYPTSLTYDDGYLYASYYGWHTDRTIESFQVKSDGTLNSKSTYKAAQQPTPDYSPIYKINPYCVSPNNILINPSKTHLLLNSCNSNQIFKFALNKDGKFNQNPDITHFERPPVEASTNPDDPTPVDSAIYYEVQPFAGAFATVGGSEIYLTSSINHNALDYTYFSQLNGSTISPNEIYPGFGMGDACWLTVHPTQTLAFMGYGIPNAGVITSFIINKDGTIQQSPQGRPASQINGAAGDMWIDPTGAYLMQIDLQHAQVYAFRVSMTGALTQTGRAVIPNSGNLLIQGMAGYVGTLT